jgi:hypothetical protein
MMTWRMERNSGTAQRSACNGEKLPLKYSEEHGRYGLARYESAVQGTFKLFLLQSTPLSKSTAAAPKTSKKSAAAAAKSSKKSAAAAASSDDDDGESSDENAASRSTRPSKRVSSRGKLGLEEEEEEAEETYCDDTIMDAATGVVGFFEEERAGRRGLSIEDAVDMD